MLSLLFFFFQAEDGIRDYKVTGVQTCALPILSPPNIKGVRCQLSEGCCFSARTGSPGSQMPGSRPAALRESIERVYSTRLRFVHSCLAPRKRRLHSSAST